LAIEQLEYDEINIFGDIKDRPELEEMIKEQGIQVEDIELLEEGAWGYAVRTFKILLILLRLIHEWLTRRKEKDVSVIIKRRDGTTFKVKSRNADKLKVYINEIKETTN